MVNPVKVLSEPIEFTIASSGSLSDAVHLGGRVPAAIQMPAAWTAASITFQVSVDGSAYGNLYGDDGTEYAVTAAASQHISLDSTKFYGAVYLKVRSGTSGTPVNQAAERTVTVMGAVPITE